MREKKAEEDAGGRGRGKVPSTWVRSSLLLTVCLLALRDL